MELVFPQDHFVDTGTWGRIRGLHSVSIISEIVEVLAAAAFCAAIGIRNAAIGAYFPRSVIPDKLSV